MKYFKTCERCRTRDRLTEATRRKKQRIGYQEASQDAPIKSSGRNISNEDTGSDDESESESVSNIFILHGNVC